MDREGKREIERRNVLREREVAGGNDQKKKNDGMQETFRKEIWGHRKGMRAWDRNCVLQEGIRMNA